MQHSRFSFKALSYLDSVSDLVMLMSNTQRISKLTHRHCTLCGIMNLVHKQIMDGLKNMDEDDLRAVLAVVGRLGKKD